MPPMTIRPATAADADTLAATVAEGFDSYRAFTPPGWEPPDMALEAERMRERLGHPGTWCELAERDGEAVGPVAFMAARSHPLGAAGGHNGAPPLAPVVGGGLLGGRGGPGGGGPPPPPGRGPGVPR